VRRLPLRNAIGNAAHFATACAVSGFAYYGLADGGMGAAAFASWNVWRLALLIALFFTTVNTTFYLQLKLSPAIAWVDARLTARWESTVAVLATLLALGGLRLAYTPLPLHWYVVEGLLLVALTVLTHWLVRQGAIGELRSMLGVFSYFNRDAANIRNRPAAGGGALMDIGCYLINTSRFLFGREPERVVGAVERDPDMGIDRMTTLMLDFGSGHAAGTCSTQMVFYQEMQIFGTTGRIELPIPFNAPPDRPCRVVVDTGKDLFGGGVREIEIETCNQYTIQGDLFSKAILDGRDVPSPIEDAVRNMACIDAIFRSARSRRWEGVA
jgi:hypothetical protein